MTNRIKILGPTICGDLSSLPCMWDMWQATKSKSKSPSRPNNQKLPPLLLSFSLRVCLFGDEIGWIENFREKMRMRREDFLESFWLKGGEVKMMVGPTWAHQKVFSPKWKENLMGENLIGEGQKCPCTSYTWASSIPFFFFF